MPRAGSVRDQRIRTKNNNNNNNAVNLIGSFKLSSFVRRGEIRGRGLDPWLGPSYSIFVLRSIVVIAEREWDPQNSASVAELRPLSWGYASVCH